MTATTALAATLYTRSSDRVFPPEFLSADTVRGLIRRARRNTGVEAVHVYECADRTGAPLHIAYVRFASGNWSNVTDVIDIYEIPTAALTDL
ncbi:hypothetical protein OG698_21320 [Streptomyces sp. NBC_01003]|uniref:hypothetical protein n=1 Tax=Streptomyces sp. NBC_01003 TaxID=2903714 RepID=UPI00386F0B55|nr:hypothetical protein OG698_21320 [Streptomyces sp. NBC_01003]